MDKARGSAELNQLQQLVDAAVSKRVAALEAGLDERIIRAIARSIFKTPLPALNHDGAPFMAYSSCNAADFMHPRFAQICSMLGRPALVHRKVWEWVFVIHHLLEAGVICPGKRGLVFGVGNEALPALFAGRGAAIRATDAPPAVGQAGGWSVTGQYSSSLDSLRQPLLCPDEQFNELVSYSHCDMTAIAPELTGFDFTWSSCCFEHLGSIQAGADFVVNSVEQCLKPGGIAVHTTELNVSSDEHSLFSGETVLYRRKDITDLVQRLRDKGHHAAPFRHAPDAHVLDYHVDVPPFTHNPHLKIELAGFITTSVGVVVRRGTS